MIRVPRPGFVPVRSLPLCSEQDRDGNNGLSLGICDGQGVVDSRKASVRSTLSSMPIRQLGWVWLCLFLLVVPVYGQSDSEMNLTGAFDFHVHQAPDSTARVIDAD